MQSQVPHNPPRKFSLKPLEYQNAEAIAKKRPFFIKPRTCASWPSNCNFCYLQMRGNGSARHVVYWHAPELLRSSKRRLGSGEYWSCVSRIAPWHISGAVLRLAQSRLEPREDRPRGGCFVVGLALPSCYSASFAFQSSSYTQVPSIRAGRSLPDLSRVYLFLPSIKVQVSSEWWKWTRDAIGFGPCFRWSCDEIDFGQVGLWGIEDVGILSAYARATESGGSWESWTAHWSAYTVQTDWQ